MFSSVGLLDMIPLWVVPFATFLVVVLSLELGYRLGRRDHRRAKADAESPVGTLIGATLSLLAFILAFTFGMAGTRYDARRQVYLSEVNAIGTVYLRADLLPEVDREPIRQALRRYVDARLMIADVAEAIRRSERIHGELWSRAAKLGREHPTSITVGLFIDSLNQLIDLHTMRIRVGLHSRIPDILWYVLYLVTFISMTVVGFQGGRSGNERSLASFGLALAFTAVIYLITDLDRPAEGLIRSQKELMQELRRSLDEPPPAIADPPTSLAE